MPGPSDVRAGAAYVEITARDNLSGNLAGIVARLRAFGQGVMSVGQQLYFLGRQALEPFRYAAQTFAFMGEDLVKMSYRTGIAAERLSALEYAALQSGIQIEELHPAFKRMGQFMERSARDVEDNVRALNQLGLSFDDLNQKQMDALDVFLEFSDAIKARPAWSEREALAVDVLGSTLGMSGAKMLPLLAQGKAGIKAMMEEGRQRGATLSEAEAFAGREFAQDLRSAWQVAKVATFTIGGALSPALKNLAQIYFDNSKAIRTWIMAHRGAIAAVAAGIAAVTALGGAMFVLGQAILLAQTPLAALVPVVRQVSAALRLGFAVATNVVIGLAQGLRVAWQGAMAGIAAAAGVAARAVRSTFAALAAGGNLVFLVAWRAGMLAVTTSAWAAGLAVRAALGAAALAASAAAWVLAAAWRAGLAGVAAAAWAAGVAIRGAFAGAGAVLRGALAGLGAAAGAGLAGLGIVFRGLGAAAAGAIPAVVALFGWLRAGGGAMQIVTAISGALFGAVAILWGAFRLAAEAANYLAIVFDALVQGESVLLAVSYVLRLALAGLGASIEAITILVAPLDGAAAALTAAWAGLGAVWTTTVAVAGQWGLLLGLLRGEMTLLGAAIVVVENTMMALGYSFGQIGAVVAFLGQTLDGITTGVTALGTASHALVTIIVTLTGELTVLEGVTALVESAWLTAGASMAQLAEVEAMVLAFTRLLRLEFVAAEDVAFALTQAMRALGFSQQSLVAVTGLLQIAVNGLTGEVGLLETAVLLLRGVVLRMGFSLEVTRAIARAFAITLQVLRGETTLTQAVVQLLGMAQGPLLAQMHLLEAAGRTGGAAWRFYGNALRSLRLAMNLLETETAGIQAAAVAFRDSLLALGLSAHWANAATQGLVLVTRMLRGEAGLAASALATLQRVGIAIRTEFALLGRLWALLTARLGAMSGASTALTTVWGILTGRITVLAGTAALVQQLQAAFGATSIAGRALAVVYDLLLGRMSVYASAQNLLAVLLARGYISSAVFRAGVTALAVAHSYAAGAMTLHAAGLRIINTLLKENIISTGVARVLTVVWTAALAALASQAGLYGAAQAVVNALLKEGVISTALAEAAYLGLREAMLLLTLQQGVLEAVTRGLIITLNYLWATGTISQEAYIASATALDIVLDVLAGKTAVLAGAQQILAIAQQYLAGQSAALGLGMAALSFVVSALTGSLALSSVQAWAATAGYNATAAAAWLAGAAVTAWNGLLWALNAALVSVKSSGVLGAIGAGAWAVAVGAAATATAIWDGFILGASAKLLEMPADSAFAAAGLAVLDAAIAFTAGDIGLLDLALVAMDALLWYIVLPLTIVAAGLALLAAAAVVVGVGLAAAAIPALLLLAVVVLPALAIAALATTAALALLGVVLFALAVAAIPVLLIAALLAIPIVAGLATIALLALAAGAVLMTVTLLALTAAVIAFAGALLVAVVAAMAVLLPLALMALPVIAFSLLALAAASLAAVAALVTLVTVATVILGTITALAVTLFFLVGGWELLESAVGAAFSVIKMVSAYLGSVLSAALQAVWQRIKEVASTFMLAWDGIQAAMASGDIKGAAIIAWQGIKVAFLQAIQDMQHAWIPFATGILLFWNNMEAGAKRALSAVELFSRVVQDPAHAAEYRKLMEDELRVIEGMRKRRETEILVSGGRADSKVDADLAAAQKQLKQLVDEAKVGAFLKESPQAGLVVGGIGMVAAGQRPRQFDTSPFPDNEALAHMAKDTKDKVSTAGTFSAAAVFGLGGSSADERTAANTGLMVGLLKDIKGKKGQNFGV